MRRSVWLRLYLPAVILLFAAAAAVLLLSRENAEQSALEELQLSLRASAERQALAAGELVSGQLEELTAFSESLADGGLSAGEALSALREKLPGSGYRKTAVVSSSGIAYYNDGITADVASDAGFLAALNGGASVEARLGERGSREGRIVLTVPFSAGSGWTALCGITDSALTELLSLSSGTDTTLILAKRDGTVITSAGAERDFYGGLFASLDDGQAASETRSDTESAVILEPRKASDSESGGLASMRDAFESGEAGAFLIDTDEQGDYAAVCVPSGLNDWMLVAVAPVSEPEYGLLPILLLTAAALLLLTLLCLGVSLSAARSEGRREGLVGYGVRSEEILRESGTELWSYEPSDGFSPASPPFSALEAERARRALYVGRSASDGRSGAKPGCPSETGGKSESTSDMLISDGDPFASRVSPESRRAFRQLMERLHSGERTVREVIRVRDGRYLRLTLRSRFTPTGEPCGAEGYAEDWTLRQDLRRRIDRQNSRLEDEPQDFLLAARWNLTRDVLEKTEGLPVPAEGSPAERLTTAICPEQPSELSVLTEGRLLRLHDVCADGVTVPFSRLSEGKPGPARLDVSLLRDPDTLEVLAFVFVSEPE